MDSDCFGAREFTVVGRPRVLMIRHSLCQAGWKVLVPTDEFELIFSSLLWCSEPSILITTKGSVRSMPCSTSSQERVHVSRNFQARQNLKIVEQRSKLSHFLALPWISIVILLLRWSF